MLGCECMRREVRTRGRPAASRHARTRAEGVRAVRTAQPEAGAAQTMSTRGPRFEKSGSGFFFKSSKGFTGGGREFTPRGSGASGAVRGRLRRPAPPAPINGERLPTGGGGRKREEKREGESN